LKAAGLSPGLAPSIDANNLVVVGDGDGDGDGDDLRRYIHTKTNINTNSLAANYAKATFPLSTFLLTCQNIATVLRDGAGLNVGTIKELEKTQLFEGKEAADDLVAINLQSCKLWTCMLKLFCLNLLVRYANSFRDSSTVMGRSGRHETALI